jgi:MoaA/NifB/PqqE/SkfB family radical SAM enzyme
MEPDLKLWTRRLLGKLADHPQPPVRVEAREAVGLQLLLFGPGGECLHLYLTPEARTTGAFWRSQMTAVRCADDKTLSALESDWLERVLAGLEKVERLPGWTDFLERAADQPDTRTASNQPALLRIKHQCNARCPFCNATGLPPDRVEGVAEVQRRLDQLRRTGSSEISFTGGEPSLHRELPEMIRRARSAGFSKVCIQTNGTLLARENIRKRITGAGLTSIFLALHSASAATHDAMLQVPGAHQKALRAARGCLEDGLAVDVSCVLTTRNLADAADTVRLVAERLGTRNTSVCLSFCSPEGRALENLDWMPRLKDAAESMARALEAGRQLGLEVRISGPCGIPMCLLPDRLEHFDEYHAREPERIPTRTHPPVCGQCRLRPRCSGFWKAYLDLHGHAELTPVRKEQEHVG